MQKKNQLLRWKLCESYFSIINSSMKEKVNFDDLCKMSEVNPKDAQKIVPKKNEGYNIFFLNILLSKLDKEILAEFKVDIAEDTISGNYEKILEGIILRLESYLPYRNAFKTLSQSTSIQAKNFLKLFEANYSFMISLLDLVEGNQNQNIKILKSIALNIVFAKSMEAFLKAKDNSLDSTIRKLDKYLRDFEDIGNMVGLIRK